MFPFTDSSSSDSDEPNTSVALELQHQECLAAIRGEKIPNQLDHEVTRASVVRGIRLHYEFATSAAVITLCATTVASIPQFTRARNARLIMSDVIPDAMDAPESQPYCFWHPDFAKQDTYRKLARAYPAMRYNVGRACAAAGYAELYAELDLLPDVTTAEEARESKNDGSRAIFDSIMAAPCRFAVMDDYKCIVDTINPRSPAFLNGDTKLRSDLTFRSALTLSDYGSKDNYKGIWTIEEDLRFDIEVVDHNWPVPDYITAEESQLLYMPLPLDLPTMDKGFLINMAAYEGNVDRYSRLRTPFMDEIEFHCVVRGIRHHTMFARWWATEIFRDEPFISTSNTYLDEKTFIKMAINARRIMNNDIIGFDKEEYLPWWFWYPLRPKPNILLSLAKLCPRMKERIAIACIYCDYQTEYDILKPVPTDELLYAAEESCNTYYKLDLKERTVNATNCVARVPTRTASEVYSSKFDIEPTSDVLKSSLDEVVKIIEDFTDDGFNTLAGETERHVWASSELLHKVEIEGGGRWEGDVLDLEIESTPEEKSIWGP